MTAETNKIPRADRIDVDRAVELVRERAGVTDLRRAAQWIMQDYRYFIRKLDSHLVENPAETMVASHEEVENEVVPYIRDTIFDDPVRFEKFCTLFLDPRGIKWREERNTSEEVTLF